MGGFTYLTRLCWIIKFVITDLSRGDFTSGSLLNLTFRCRHLLQIETPAVGLGFEIQAMSFREDLRKVRKKASFCMTHWTQQNGSSNTSSQWVVQLSKWLSLLRNSIPRETVRNIRNISVCCDKCHSHDVCVVFFFVFFFISVLLSDCWEMTVIAVLDTWYYQHQPVRALLRKCLCVTCLAI